MKPSERPAPDSAPSSAASPASTTPRLLSHHIIVAVIVVVLLGVIYALLDEDRSSVSTTREVPSRETGPHPDRSTYYYQPLSAVQIQRLERYDTMLLIPPMTQFQYASFAAFRDEEQVTAWSGDTSCPVTVDYPKNGAAPPHVVLPGGSFDLTSGLNLFSGDLDGNGDTQWLYPTHLFSDGQDLGVIWKQCGPLVIDKYNPRGELLFRTQLGSHAHSFGVLAQRRGQVFAFDFEAVFDSRLLGASLIRVVDWGDGREIRKLAVLMMPVTTLALDQDERFLYLVNLQSETTTVSGLKLDLARLP